MWVEGIRNVTQASYRRELAKMGDAQVMAQEICQKGAIHALTFLLRNGPVNEQRVREILVGLGNQAQWITAELRRRRLPTVDDPRGN